MRKMLAIAFVLALPGSAWAADQIDRSTLSYDENAVINAACAKSSAKGAGEFNACVAQQVAALHDHPSSDLSGLSPAHKSAIDEVCGYLRLQGIGPYNDCVAKAMTEPAKDEHAQKAAKAKAESRHAHAKPKSEHAAAKAQSRHAQAKARSQHAQAKARSQHAEAKAKGGDKAEKILAASGAR